MIQTFNDNIESLSFLTEDEIQDFEEQNKKAVAESLLPAFQDVIDVLTSLKGTGKNDGGLCNYEGGKEYYAYLCRMPREQIRLLTKWQRCWMRTFHSL